MMAGGAVKSVSPSICIRYVGAGTFWAAEIKAHLLMYPAHLTYKVMA